MDVDVKGASLNGHKLPKLDFNWLRAIAISEYVCHLSRYSLLVRLTCSCHGQDKVKDTMEAWRIDPRIMFADIIPRGLAVVPSLQYAHLSPQEVLYEQINHAFVSALMKFMVGYIPSFLIEELRLVLTELL